MRGRRAVQGILIHSVLLSDMSYAKKVIMVVAWEANLEYCSAVRNSNKNVHVCKGHFYGNAALNIHSGFNHNTNMHSKQKYAYNAYKTT